jgi:hypothetical protein
MLSPTEAAAGGNTAELFIVERIISHRRRRGKVRTRCGKRLAWAWPGT